MVIHRFEGKGCLLGLHSLPRAGKDTLAKELIEHHGFVRFSFAGPLYEEVSQAFGAAIELLESDDWKKRPQKSLALLNCNDPAFRGLMESLGFTMDEPLTSRQILQNWGTEYRRHQNKSYWTDQMWDRLGAFFERGEDGYASNENRAVITDARVYKDGEGEVSYDEAELLDEFGHMAGVKYRMVEILRDGTQGSEHSSDLRFPDPDIHLTITNDSTPEQMRLNVVAYLRQEGLEI